MYNRVCLRLKLCLPFSETSLFKDIGTVITRITSIWKTHKDSHCVAVTVCKTSHGQESYLRVLNGIFISKEYSILEKQKKNLIPKSIASSKNIMNCGDIEEIPGVLDQFYSNNNFVTTAVLGVRNYVLLETKVA